MIRRRPLACLLLAALLAAGCASYTPRSALVPSGADLRWYRASDGFTVGIDPYAEIERQKAVFDADFHDKRVVAVHVVLRNDTGRRLVLRPSDMMLELADGRQVVPSGGTAVATKVGESGSVLGASLAFGLIGFIASTQAEEQARTARINDYRQKELQDATLEAGGEARGFVYFIPPPGTPPFADGTLTLRVSDVAEARPITHRVPLTRLAYRGWDIDGKFLAAAQPPVTPVPSMAAAPAPSPVPAPPGVALQRAVASPAATAPVAAASATTPVAVAAVGTDPALRALVGSWTGTLTSPYGAGGSGIGGRRVHQVELTVYEDTGRVAWTLHGGSESMSGSGHVRLDQGTVVLSGSQRWGGSSAPVDLVLERKLATMEGNVLAPDNRVYTLSLQRAR